MNVDKYLKAIEEVDTMPYEKKECPERAEGEGERVGRKYSEEDIINFINQYKEQNGWCPSVREIGKGVGITSTAVVQDYLFNLHKKGRIIYKGVRQIKIIA